jgi:membrane protease YdiL (CAAX protease family)
MLIDSAALNLRGNTTHIVTRVGKSPAAWLFAALWLGSALILVVSGNGFPFFSLLMGAAYLLFSVLTVAITQAAPHGSATRAERPRLWLQIGLILLFILLTAWSGLAFHKVVVPDASLPLWSPLLDWLQQLGDQWFGNSNYIANPVTYVALPLLVLLLAGARLPELGLARGHRVGRVLLLWCAIPLVYFAYALLSGQLTLGRLSAHLISNFMQNGFFEEFLFRGALQTRLRRLWSPSWALVIQALLFGAWHLGLGYANTSYTGLLPALASAIVTQAVIGLAFGAIFERTRNPTRALPRTSKMWGGKSFVSIVRATLGFAFSASIFGEFVAVARTNCVPSHRNPMGIARGKPSSPV